MSNNMSQHVAKRLVLQH